MLGYLTGVPGGKVRFHGYKAHRGCQFFVRVPVPEGATVVIHPSAYRRFVARVVACKAVAHNHGRAYRYLVHVKPVVGEYAGLAGLCAEAGVWDGVPKQT